MSELPQSLKLDLADGRRWLIRPLDGKAAAVVAELGRVMGLGPACESGGPGKTGRELCVAVSDESDVSDRSDSETGPVICRLADATDRDTQAIQMRRIASAIAHEVLVRGGLLLHAALAEYQGSGLLMAGPSGVGKSTASRHLPSPWRSLCDDLTLAVRDAKGRFWAHPWPTWSRFHLGGPGGSWPVEQAVPLRAISFLAQSPSDRLDPVNVTQATALTLESAVELVWEASRLAPENGARSLSSQAVRAARALAAAVPAFSLKLSLHGRFWEEIERVLTVRAPEPQTPFLLHREPLNPRTPEPTPVPLTPGPLDPASFRVVYAGPSMNPTLQEPDLLDVQPYGVRRVHVGDVVYFKLPGTDAMVVHRVSSVGPRPPVPGHLIGGVRTRGDNNGTVDPWVLQAGDIIGRVVAAQRGARRRKVRGGRLSVAGLRSRLVVRRVLGRCARSLQSKIQIPKPHFPVRLLPPRLRPRLVRFDARYRLFLKLLMGRRTVGQYDYRRERWFIKRPFRLFVDERTLPRPESIVRSPVSKVHGPQSP